MRALAGISSLSGALLLALSLSACTLYIDDDDAPPVPVEPPPQQPPAVDAGTLPPPTIPPPPPELRVAIPEDMRGGHATFLEVTRQHEGQPTEQELVPIPADASELTLPLAGTDLMSLSLYTAGGELIDADVVSGRCPLLTLGEAGRILQVPVEYAGIQEAIDAARAGDIVYVHPGTYQERIRMRTGIRLIGAGASRTILDGGGEGRSLIDFTGARSVVVRGFTLHNVGPGETCSRSGQTPFDCSGDWYPAAVSGDGHSPQTREYCPGSSIVLTHNIIEGSATGVMLYFHAPAVVRNNLFIDNGDAVVANHLNDHALIMSNTFIGSQYTAIADDGYLGITNNVIASAPVGISYDIHEGVWGSVEACNLFDPFVADPGEHIDIGVDGNLSMDPGFRDPVAGDYRISEDSEAAFLGCHAPGIVEVGDVNLEPGAFGGAAGNWFQQELTVEDVARLFAL